MLRLVLKSQHIVACLASLIASALGQHFTIGEMSRLEDKFTDPLPEAVLNMLYRETDDIKGVDVSALRDDQTYRGGGRHLRYLIEARKEAYQRKPGS